MVLFNIIRLSFKISCSTRILQRIRRPFPTHFPNAFLSPFDQQGSDSSQPHPTGRLNHRSDSVQPPSCQRRQTAEGTRANCAAPRDVVVKMTSSEATASTSTGNFVATTCRSYDTRRMIAATSSSACGCNPISGSSIISNGGHWSSGRFKSVTRKKNVACRQTSSKARLPDH